MATMIGDPLLVNLFVSLLGASLGARKIVGVRDLGLLGGYVLLQKAVNTISYVVFSSADIEQNFLEESGFTLRVRIRS
jgi:hypothetical protein